MHGLYNISHVFERYIIVMKELWNREAWIDALEEENVRLRAVSYQFKEKFGSQRVFLATRENWNFS